MAAAGTCGCSRFVHLLAVKEANASTIDSRGTAHVTLVQYHESSPRSTERQETGRYLKTSQDQNMRWSQYLCPMSAFHDPVD